MRKAGGGPFAPHPAYAFTYRFPQFAVTPEIHQNLLRPTAKGCGPQGLYADCPGATTYPLSDSKGGVLNGLGAIISKIVLPPQVQRAIAPRTRSVRMSGLGFLGDDDPTGLGPAGGGVERIDITPVSEIEKLPTTAEKVGAAIWGVASVAGTALGAYHGYKRNNSVGWGIWWALMGGMFPVVTVPVALAQGLGKRRGR